MKQVPGKYELMKLYFYEIYETSCGILNYEAGIFMNTVLSDHAYCYKKLKDLKIFS